MDVFWLIASGVVLAWGLIMLFSPGLFWKLARVDWNADVLDPANPRRRHILQLAGLFVSLISGSMLFGLVRALMR